MNNFFFLFFNLNSCCFLYSANNSLVFLVLVLHEILTEEILCAASHFYTVICKFFILWNVFLATCHAWRKEEEKPFLED